MNLKSMQMNVDTATENDGQAVVAACHSFSVALLRIEVDAAGYSYEHIAVSDPVILGSSHSDTITSWVYHGLEMTREVDPVVNGIAFWFSGLLDYCCLPSLGS